MSSTAGSPSVKLAGVQMDVEIGQPRQNLDRMLAALRETAGEGAHLTVFPECALTGYCFDGVDEARAFAEPIPGPSTEAMARACDGLHMHAVFGLLERSGDRIFNACALVGPEGVIGSYRKAHLPFLGVDRFTTLGDRPFQVFPAAAAKVGMLICYDGSFPEPARALSLDGADIIALPTNWPPGGECTAAHVINARALENNVYFIAVNRVGTERGFRFIGGSKICAPSGATLAEAPHERETVVYAECDLAVAREKHLVRVPRLHEIDRFADRRPELYGRITEPKGR